MDRDLAVLMIAASEFDSDLYYATGFLAPDPFIHIQHLGRKVLVMNDLELDRAKSQAKVDDILALSKYEAAAKARGKERPGTTDTVAAILQEMGIKRLMVPAIFPLRHADDLRSRGFEITTKPDPFFEERMFKSEEEIAKIRASQIAVERALEKALGILAESTVRNSVLSYRDEPVTSESIKKVINVGLMELDCVSQHTIIAAGRQGCDPHNEGSGPLRPNEGIVMDIFPRSGTTRYFSDMTRTVVKGKAPDGLKKLYDAVLEGQLLGLSMVKDGADGKEIHAAITSLFDRKGYTTGVKDGRMQGYFHGTGHGLGLDVHEPPRINKSGELLKSGMVVTVEPGLYYHDIGAVRIEDLVVVRKDGCENLTTFPKELEIR